MLPPRFVRRIVLAPLAILATFAVVTLSPLLMLAALIFAPGQSLGVLAWLVGIVVAFLGLREAFFAALHLLPELEAKAKAPDAERRRVSGRRIAFVSGVAIVLIAATAWFVLRSDDTAAALPHEVTYVNGSAAIADRPVDRVIFPTTHNSMSGANVPGWMFPKLKPTGSRM